MFCSACITKPLKRGWQHLFVKQFYKIVTSNNWCPLAGQFRPADFGTTCALPIAMSLPCFLCCRWCCRPAILISGSFWMLVSSPAFFHHSLLSPVLWFCVCFLAPQLKRCLLIWWCVCRRSISTRSCNSRTAPRYWIKYINQGVRICKAHVHQQDYWNRIPMFEYEFIEIKL